jgi:hypothetical protein
LTDRVGRIVEVAVIVLGLATSAHAQTNANPRQFTLPVVSFGLSGNLSHDVGWHTAGVSTSVMLARHIFTEAEVLRTRHSERWTSATASAEEIEDAWRVTVGLVYRTDPRDISVWFGGGLQAVHWKHRENWYSYAPLDFGATRQVDRAVHVYASTGVHFRLGQRLSIFAGARFSSFHREHVAFTVGARVAVKSVAIDGDEALRARPTAAAAPQSVTDHIGEKVQLTLLTGTRHSGALVALTAGDVILRVDAANPARARDEVYPLRDVRRVELERHTGRTAALWAGIITFGAVTLLSCGQGDEEDCWPEFGLLFGGAAAGIGALVGAWRDQQSLPRRVLYPASTSSASVVPSVSRRTLGACVVVRW